MELRPLDGSVSDRARELYEASFPEAERIPFDDLVAMSDDRHRFVWMEDGGEFLGLMYTVESDSLVFLLYLAISPGWRNCGLGSDALWMLKCSSAGRRIFLNVEPTDEPAENMGQRLRRMNFYDRNGFSVQAVYRTPDGMRYALMSWGGPVTPEEASRFYSEDVPPRR